MISVNKTKIDKKYLSVIVTASVLAFLIIAYVVINAISGIAAGTNQGGSTPPEIMDGEGIYNNTATVYPYISKSQIISIAVMGHNDSFVISRPQVEKENTYESYFMLYRGDENDKLTPYFPDILTLENGISYTSFYSSDGVDGLNIYKIDYLCAAIGALYFEQRILPEEDRESQLARYGLDPESRETIYFSYLDSDKNLKEHKIFVGDKLISGVGYYFMIEGRDHIYASSQSERLNYLLGSFESLIKPNLVAPGAESDGIYEPYLTTDYKQWTNKYYGISNGGEGLYPSDDSYVIAYADIIETIYDSNDSSAGDGYRNSGYYTLEFDLRTLSLRDEFKPLVSALKNNTVGNYDSSEIFATVVHNTNEAVLGKTYTYKIYELEGVINDSGEYYEEGYSAFGSDLVMVKYYLYIDDKEISAEPCHAIIDLSKESVIPQNVKETLQNAKVGDQFTGNNLLAFDVVYTEENAVCRTLDFVITDIEVIWNFTADGNINPLKAITPDAYVTYSYKYLLDGKEIGREGTETVNLSAITEGDDLAIKKAILGMGVGENVNKVVLTEMLYCQPLMNFTSYSIQSIKGFVEKEMVVSFEFVNGSDRDPFYGESIYMNTLTNENSLYALDALACQTVTFLLGGVGGSASSQLSQGLSGIETVAVGLSPQNMDKYGLYDGYTVYFELPRVIYSLSSEGNNGSADFGHYYTLGGYLYISKPQSDGSRYIASELYDLVARIDGSQFDFLEKSFDEYWARKNLVMIDYKEIDKMTVDINMSDISGKYEFDLTHKLTYIFNNQKYDEKPEEGGTEYNSLEVTVKPLSQNISNTALKDILISEGRESLDVANIYNRVAGGFVSIGYDTAGAANFKKILSLMYGTNYSGVIDRDEREEIIGASTKILTISIKLTDLDYYYTYEFYRISDRRVVVNIFRSDSEGRPLDQLTDSSSGFFITNFGAKKIVNAFMSLLNGENINVDADYWQ